MSPRIYTLRLTLAVSLAVPLISATVQAAEPTSAVLGFDGAGDDESAELTRALRAELAARGMPNETTMGLVELRMTMGCEEGDTPCLAEAGKSLGADRLVYGRLTRDAKGFTADLRILDVASASVEKTASAMLSRDALGADAGMAAKQLVDALLGPADPSAPVAEPEGPLPASDAEPKDSALIWGKHRPVAPWKIAGLAVSASLAAASLATAIGTTITIADGGPQKQKLLDAAAASLEDDKPSNDIDPNSQDLCALAREELEANKVRNAAVTGICNDGDALAKVATATWITTGVFAASTIVFAILTSVRRDQSKSSMFGKHKASFSAAPTPGGAFMGARWNF